MGAPGRARRAHLDGSLTVFAAVDDEPAGAFLLEDPIRPDAPRMVRALREAGITRVVLVTGDRTDIADMVGRVSPQLRVRQDGRWVPQVRCDGRHALASGQQRPGMGRHHGVVVDVATRAAGFTALGHLMSIMHGRQSRTQVNERALTDALAEQAAKVEAIEDQLANLEVKWAAGKLADLSMALAGRFTEHHALLCRLHRDASPASAPRSLTWMSGSWARPHAGNARQTCLRPFPGSGTW